jgi:hypothetical protein
MVQPCEDIDCRPIFKEIQHHLPSDFLGIRTDAFGHDAVIRCEHVGSLI